MTLTDKAKNSITTQIKNQLALELNCSVYTVERWIRDNEENGDLTKAKAVEIIAAGTNIPADEVLLKVPEPQN